MIIFAWLISTALWLCVWIPFYLLGFLVTWAGLVGRSRDAEHMWFPWWFWDSNAGINGTIDYMNLNWVGICNPWVLSDYDPFATAKSVVNSMQGKERTFVRRWQWVTWRNPVTNVSRWLIGCGEKKNIWQTNWEIGRLKIERLTAGIWWSYSFSFRWTDKHYSFYRFGWKLDDVQQGRSCFMYRITPWRSV